MTRHVYKGERGHVKKTFLILSFSNAILLLLVFALYNQDFRTATTALFLTLFFCFIPALVVAYIWKESYASLVNENYKLNNALEANRNEQSALREEVNKLSIIDPLTQLYSRSCFYSTLDQVWKISERTKQSLSLILVQVDGLKDCNSIVGFETGDHFLIEIAKIIENTLRRPDDMAFRFDGKTFAVILPRTNNLGARNISLAIKDNLQNVHSPCNRNLSISSSVTTEDFTGTRRSPHELIGKAMHNLDVKPKH